MTSRRPVTADDPQYTQSILTPADTAPIDPTAAIYAPPDRYLAHGLTEPINHWMRDAQKRTVEGTWRHIGCLVVTIDPTECANYIANAG